MTATAKEILEADLANILAKVKAGKRLTTTERAVVTAASHGRESRPTEGKVPTWAALAEALGITIGFMKAWSKLEGAPEPDTAGRHNVSAWIDFVAREGLVAEKNAGKEEESSPIKELEEALKLRADRQWKEEKVRIIRKEHMPLALSKSVHAQVILHAKDVLLAKPDVIGLKLSAEFGVDTVRVSQIVRKEIEEALALLAKFEYPK